MSNCESSLVPASKLRQVVNIERCSEVMKLAIDRMAYELNSVSIRKKSTMFKVMSYSRMLRHIIGFDSNEFAALFHLCLQHMKN